MEEGFKRREDSCPKLLDLIPNGRQWMVRDAGGGGGSGLGAEEERKLELRLGPPGGEEEPSILSLGYFPKTSKATTTNISNLCSGAKRGFLDTVECKQQDHHQQQQKQQNRAGQGKEVSTNTSGKAEQQHQSLERKACSQTRTATATATAPVVGWPPIRSFRKNIASSSSKPSLESQNEEGEANAKLNCRKSLLVKINMDGIPIGRKVDLKVYDSYEKLPLAVEELFRGLLEAQKDPSVVESRNHGEEEQIFSGLLDGTGKYTLVYEGNEGERMLVGDVPWDMFLATARRLRVLKTSEISGLLLAGGKRTTTRC